MEIEIRPSKHFNSQPFKISIAFNETIENLINMISLSITTVTVDDMEIIYQGKRIKNKKARLDQIGITNGGTVDLRRKSLRCCEIF